MHDSPQILNSWKKIPQHLQLRPPSPPEVFSLKPKQNLLLFISLFMRTTGFNKDCNAGLILRTAHTSLPFTTPLQIAQASAMRFKKYLLSTDVMFLYTMVFLRQELWSGCMQRLLATEILNFLEASSGLLN